MFSQANLPLCSMRGNYGLWAKTFEKKKKLIQLTKSPVRPANSEFCQAPNLQWEFSSIGMNASNEEEVSESFSFAFYFLNAIFIWYTRHFKYSCMRCSRTTENNNWQSDHVRTRSWQTIKTRNIIQRNI